jgi:hypothetical protein
MPEPRAQRTLVKSPPEIWAEVSDVSTLARHLGEFGEIRITRLEAETTVVWEGDRARGTVELEASGWGTKVTITAEAIATDDAEVVEAEAVEAEAAGPVEEAAVAVDIVEKDAAPVEAEVVEALVEVETETEAETEPEAETEVEPKAETAPAPIAEPRRGFFARLLRRHRTETVAEPMAIEPPPAVVIREPEPIASEPEIIPVDSEPVAIEPEIVPTVAGPEPEAEIPDALEVTGAAEITEITEPALDGEIAASATAATAALEPEQVEAVLVGVLDDLGSAHHRPFSRG